jgi:hypothetical protein
MPRADGPRCPACKYANEPEALACSLCGAVLVAKARAPEPEPTPPPPDDDARFRPPGHVLRPAEPQGPPPTWSTHVPASVLNVAVGIPGAIALNFLCCGLLGWGMGAPAHEFGHAIAAWLMGYPAIPLPVVTYWGPRSVVAFLMAWGLVATLVWHWRPRRDALIALGVVTVALWGVALHRTHEMFMLWAGHGGEVSFAAVFFYLALRGGLDKPHERPIYATLAWSAWFNNMHMFKKLITDPGFQYRYHIQSFVGGDGTNDYSRIASHFGTTVATAATVGLLTSLVIPPLGVLAYWWGHRGELWDEAVALPAWLRRRATTVD